MVGSNLQGDTTHLLSCIDRDRSFYIILFIQKYVYNWLIKNTQRASIKRFNRYEHTRYFFLFAAKRFGYTKQQTD